MPFEGFGAAAFEWFGGLERDNSKAWFDAHREQYRSDVRGPLEAMLEELREEFGGRVKMFRQNRDVRFSPDKSPYKTTTYGLLVDRAESAAGLYAELSADGLFAGTGYYGLASDQLARYRQAVGEDAGGSALVDVVARLEPAGLELFGKTLTGAPRGFRRSHPRIELLRHTALITGAARRPKPAGGLSREVALAHAKDVWGAAAGLNAWLDRHVGPSRHSPEERFGRGRGR